MDMHKLLLGVMPGISAIFTLGFIPEKDEIYEFSSEQYAVYLAQGGDLPKPLYTVISKKFGHLTPVNEIPTFTEDNVANLMEAASFLRKYAKKNGCKSKKSADILKFAAEYLPPSLTKGTSYERPPLKVLKKGEKSLTEREEWIDFMANAFGEGVVLNVKVVNQETKETEIINIPLKNQR